MRSLSIYSFIALLCTSLVGVNSLSAIPEQASFVSQIGKSKKTYSNYQYDPYISRIHQDAYYHLVGLSSDGTVLQLQDASKWVISYKQSNISRQWVQNDDIFIKPQSNWFSTYKYVLHNITTQQTVEANLTEPPLFNGANTLRIVNIEPYARLVQLSDNTIWQIEGSDYNFPYWQIGQRLIIGVNNKWRDAVFPNIIINADIANAPCSQANFYGYPAGY